MLSFTCFNDKTAAMLGHHHVHWFLRDIPFKPEHKRALSVYTDDITIVLFNKVINSTLKRNTKRLLECELTRIN